jgi:hypothetical protein
MHGLHERNSEVVTQIIAGDRPSTPRLRPPSPEEVAEQVTKAGKDIFKISRPLISTALQPFMAIGIVDLSFLNIAEHLIGLSTLFKTGLGLFIIRIAVRVILHGMGPISLLDLTATCSPAYRQYIIIIF